MEGSGRHWAGEVYRDGGYIFEYSAASIATFLHHNPGIPYTVYTDDPEGLATRMEAYDVNTSNLNIDDSIHEKLSDWKRDAYCFWPIVSLAAEVYDGSDDTLKLDNDLTCLRPIDELVKQIEDGKAAMWKRERLCSAGREYWGERLAARTALGTEDFTIWNMGVMGLNRKHHAGAKSIRTDCRRIADVDISSVSYFPDAPGKKTNTWNCAEQTAVSYFLHRDKLDVIETTEFFDHHCYVKSKQGVIESARYLLK